MTAPRSHHARQPGAPITWDRAPIAATPDQLLELEDTSALQPTRLPFDSAHCWLCWADLHFANRCFVAVTLLDCGHWLCYDCGIRLALHLGWTVPTDPPMAYP
jgi:hypothetical protein